MAMSTSKLRFTKFVYNFLRNTQTNPKFEGHVKPNEDEYQKSAQLKFTYCLGVS